MYISKLLDHIQKNRLHLTIFECAQTFFDLADELGIRNMIFHHRSKTTSRSIVVRHGTPYNETIKVKRTFMHPEYRFPLGYNDIALSELSRRVIFDFDKYGDTPICSGPSRLLDGQKAITQGMEERSGGTVGWSRLGEFSLGSIHT